MVRFSFADLCVADVGRSVAWYRDLFGLDVLVDHGWYAELGIDGRTMLALVSRGHPTVPIEAGGRPSGLLVSFDVDDTVAYYDRACSTTTIVHDLADELGQRHFMVADPDGAVVDVIQRIPLAASELRRLAQLRRAAS